MHENIGRTARRCSLLPNSMINFLESNTIEFHFVLTLNQHSSIVTIEIDHGIYMPPVIYVCKRLIKGERKDSIFPTVSNSAI